MNSVNVLRFTIIIAILITLSGCAGLVSKDSDIPEPDEVSFNPAFMDLSVKPGDDFYRYANGGWLDSNPIPPAFGSYSTFTELWIKNNELVKSIVTDPVLQEAEPGSVQRKIGDFYGSGMDTLVIEELGMGPIRAELAAIDRITTMDDVQEYLSRLHRQNIFALFNIYPDSDDKEASKIIAQLQQGGIGMTNRDYYFNEDDRSSGIRQAYETYIKTIFGLIDRDDAGAEVAFQAIWKIEASLAEHSLNNVELRDLEKNYNPMHIKELRDLSPAFEWMIYFQRIDVGDPGLMNVRQPEFIRNISILLSEVPVEDWREYFRWEYVRAMSGLLTRDFQEASFAFYGTAMQGSTEMQPRWRRVLATMEGSIGEAIGQEYVARHFPPAAKQRMLVLVEDLRTAYAARIEALDWMKPETKAQALAKLNTMKVKIGYPDEWTDYNELEIEAGAYAENVVAGRSFVFRQEMDKIGKPLDPGDWFMTPQTVNAYYSPNYNEIVFPAGILQPPMFYLEGDDAVNYGGIGMVIGHEFTHGFDDQGRYFDAQGNREDWWSEADAANFKVLTDRLVEQYNHYMVADTVPVNGELTLGENIADVGGMAIAYDALQIALERNGHPGEIDGFTPEQRFYLSFARVWASNDRDEALIQRVMEDPHSPRRYRVIGTIANSNPFFTAFDLQADEPMYVAPEDRIIIW